MISRHSPNMPAKSGFAGAFDSEPPQMASPLSEQLTGEQPPAARHPSGQFIWSGADLVILDTRPAAEVGAVSSAGSRMELRHDAILGGSLLGYLKSS